MRLKPRRRVVVPAKPATAPPPRTQDLEDAWGEASILYANRRGMRIGRHWGYGVSERLFPDRFDRLVGRAGAKRVSHLLCLLSDADLRVFQTRAAISHEQAVAGARMTLILNVSGPIGFVVLLTNLLPGGAEAAFAGEPEILVGFLVGAVVAAAILLFLVWYAFAGVHQARDLYHLATLEMAKRGIASTMGGGDQNPTETKL